MARGNIYKRSLIAWCKRNNIDHRKHSDKDLALMRQAKLKLVSHKITSEGENA